MNVAVENVKILLESLKEPVIINNILNWNLLQWDLEKWLEVLGDEELEFRMGKNEFSKENQWERSTESVKGTFKDFLDFSKENKGWLYFDYKYLNQWLSDKKDLKNVIDWSKFGFSDKSAEDSVIWIGTKGAHTPCHKDSYGFNLVAQIYGRKSWLLFPPEEDLHETRVPYEESSIYSQINFYSPNEDECKELTNSRHVILQPGQVLVVPSGWWHYVENLETAISINVWLPLVSDHEKRINEAITQTLINGITGKLDNIDQQIILNPNENFDNFSIYDSMNIIQHSIENFKKLPPIETYYYNEDEIKCIIHDNRQYIHLIPKLSCPEFLDWIRMQASRFNIANNYIKKEKDKYFCKVINSITDTEVIELIKKKLLSQQT